MAATNGIESRLMAPWGWALVSVLVGAACGGKSNTAGHEPSVGGGGSSAGAVVSHAGAPSSSGGRDGTAGSPSPSGGNSTAQGGANASAGHAMGGAGTGSGAGAVAMVAGEAGSGGAAECLDVCEREGGACCFPGAECVSPLGGCTIDILAGKISVTKEYEAIAARVAALSPELLVSLSDADVARADIEAPFAARLEVVLTSEASLRAADLEDAELHPFRVSCEGHELFVGIVYGLIGAAAIDAPVMHVSRNPDDRLVLRLGAWQSAWAGLSAPPDREPLKQRLDRPELRAGLCRDGVLGQL